MIWITVEVLLDSSNVFIDMEPPPQVTDILNTITPKKTLLLTREVQQNHNCIEIFITLNVREYENSLDVLQKVRLSWQNFIYVTEGFDWHLCHFLPWIINT